MAEVSDSHLKDIFEKLGLNASRGVWDFELKGRLVQVPVTIASSDLDPVVTAEENNDVGRAVDSIMRLVDGEDTSLRTQINYDRLLTLLSNQNPQSQSIKIGVILAHGTYLHNPRPPHDREWALENKFSERIPVANVVDSAQELFDVMFLSVCRPKNTDFHPINAIVNALFYSREGNAGLTRGSAVPEYAGPNYFFQ